MLPSADRHLAGVLWDLDGTLLESRGLWEAAYHEFAEHRGMRLAPNLWERVGGHTLEESVALLFPDVGLSAGCGAARASSWLVSRVGQLVEEHPGRLEWRDGARHALQVVQGAGVPTALVTTTWRSLADRIITTLNIRFDVVVCGDEVARGKPAPDPYLRAVALLGASPAGCVAVEDSPAGVAAAEMAGVAVLAVPSYTAITPRTRRAVRSSLVGLTVTELTALARRDDSQKSSRAW